MLKIVTVVGARPQFIKAATVSRAIRSRSGIEEIIVHTGQHFDENMSEIFFKEMDIPHPTYNLHIESLPHGAMTGRMMEGIEKILLNENPDWVLVYGDTNSTLAGALAASKLHIKLAHVEAGLRTYNMLSPEEVNRIITDRLSSLLFCPTDLSVRNLKSEGYDNFSVQIENSGDVMFDAALFYSEISQKPDWLESFSPLDNFVLATIHRAENTEDLRRLREIIRALNEINKSVPVILPLHPRTKKIIDASEMNLDFKPVDPVGYLEMIYLLKNCEYILSDSGGLQKEAYFFKKSCLILKDETEWQELVEHGPNQIVGADYDRIINASRNIDVSTGFDQQFYGDGFAAEKIVDYLQFYI
jgi:UDP-GlcNAc3NAcA epimerase